MWDGQISSSTSEQHSSELDDLELPYADTAGEDGGKSKRNKRGQDERKLPLSAVRLMRHCRRHYNILFGQRDGAARLPDPSDSESESDDDDDLDLELVASRPTPYHSIQWEDFGVSRNTTEARKWAYFVRQLMLAGNIVSDKVYKLRLPQADTPLDGVDLGVQMRMLRRHGDYEMLSTGAAPGGGLARWLQRFYRPRVPKLVGVWFNMSAGKWPNADRRRVYRPKPGHEEEEEVQARDTDLIVPGTCLAAALGHADMRMISRTTSLDDTRYFTRHLTSNVLPAAISAATENYVTNEANLTLVCAPCVLLYWTCRHGLADIPTLPSHSLLPRPTPECA